MIEDKYVDQQGIYLLSHSVGLPIKTANASADQSFWQPWLAGGEGIWNHWLAEIERFRELLGE